MQILKICAWAAIKGKPNKSKDAIKYKNMLSPDLINQFFATVANYLNCCVYYCRLMIKT